MSDDRTATDLGSGGEALAAVPRRRFLTGPSPLYRLDGFSERFGRSVWIKRDDLTGVGLGGNKTRKLEYLMADALARGATAVVTGGGVQSNHASATAILARRMGLGCHLALAETVPLSSELYDEGGNVAIDRLCRATLRRYPQGTDSRAAIEDLADRIEAEHGRRPYVIPVGGSNAVGGLGFVRAGLELARQAGERGASIDAVVLASGSGGTQAGLLVGLALAGRSTRVIGISVSRTERSLRPIIGALCQELAQRVGVVGIDWEQRIEVDDRFVGEGYGLPSEATWTAIETLIETDAVVSDPVYSGKAIEGLLHRLDREPESLGDGCLFWHTGGVSGLLAYADPIRHRYERG